MRASSYLLIVMALAFNAIAQQNESKETPLSAAPAPTLRAQERVLLQRSDAQARALDITIRRWSLVAGQSLDPFPERGHLIMHLRAGQVATVIDGKREQRKEGDFWEVAPEQSCRVEVTSEMATLEVTAIKPFVTP